MAGESDTNLLTACIMFFSLEPENFGIQRYDLSIHPLDEPQVRGGIHDPQHACHHHGSGRAVAGSKTSKSLKRILVNPFIKD
jgi:hypothetical protein